MPYSKALYIPPEKDKKSLFTPSAPQDKPKSPGFFTSLWFKFISYLSAIFPQGWIKDPLAPPPEPEPKSLLLADKPELSTRPYNTTYYTYAPPNISGFQPPPAVLPQSPPLISAMSITNTKPTPTTTPPLPNLIPKVPLAPIPQPGQVPAPTAIQKQSENFSELRNNDPKVKAMLTSEGPEAALYKTAVIMEFMGTYIRKGAANADISDEITTEAIQKLLWDNNKYINALNDLVATRGNKGGEFYDAPGNPIDLKFELRAIHELRDKIYDLTFEGKTEAEQEKITDHLRKIMDEREPQLREQLQNAILNKDKFTEEREKSGLKVPPTINEEMIDYLKSNIQYNTNLTETATQETSQAEIIKPQEQLPPEPPKEEQQQQKKTVRFEEINETPVESIAATVSDNTAPTGPNFSGATPPTTPKSILKER